MTDEEEPGRYGVPVELGNSDFVRFAVGIASQQQQVKGGDLYLSRANFPTILPADTIAGFGFCRFNLIQMLDWLLILALK